MGIRLLVLQTAEVYLNTSSDVALRHMDVISMRGFQSDPCLLVTSRREAFLFVQHKKSWLYGCIIKETFTGVVFLAALTCSLLSSSHLWLSADFSFLENAGSKEALQFESGLGRRLSVLVAVSWPKIIIFPFSSHSKPVGLFHFCGPQHEALSRIMTLLIFCTKKTKNKYKSFG